jgi:hypothetical protein
LSQSALLAQAAPVGVQPVRSVLQVSGCASLQRFCPAVVQVGATQADFVLSHSAADAQVATTSQPVRCALQIWSTAGFSGSQRRSPTAHSGVWQMFSSPSYLLSQSPAVAHLTEVKLWPSAVHVLSVALFGSHQTELGLQLLQRWFAASQNVGQVWLACDCPSAEQRFKTFPEQVVWLQTSHCWCAASQSAAEAQVLELHCF